MITGQVFERFVESSPVSVMVRGLLETILCPQKLDELFEKNTTTQYTFITTVLYGSRDDEYSSLWD